MATYYNYISVKDQLLHACQNSKCDLDLISGIPKDIKGFRIDTEWIAKCSDPCTKGWCEIHIYIFIPSITIPQTINLYYVKKSAVAYISFNSQVLDILIKNEILKKNKLQIEENAPKILPDTLL